MKVRRIGDDIAELPVANARLAQLIAARMRELGLADEVVAGLQSVSVMAHPAHLAAAIDGLQDLSQTPETDIEDGPIMEIGVHYGGPDGPDFDAICAATGLAAQALIGLHTSAIYRVDMIGFTPGFSYLSGLPAALSVPRRASPRPRVAAGSVGLGVGYTGLYAMAGPGGWPLIGRTDHVLFDPAASDPFGVHAGQLVRFRAI